MTKLIFGCGYLGSRVARRWQQAGHDVHVITRYADRAHRFADEGFTPRIADVTRPESLRQLPTADTVLYAVGFDRSAAPTIDEVYVGGVTNVVAHLPNNPRCFIYISSTGVYGDASGAWVDEQIEPQPQRAGGKASLAAEQTVLQQQPAQSNVALRLGGIYGPGRIPYLDKLQQGDPLPVATEGWLNLIHVEDAADVVVKIDELASSSRLEKSLVMNVTDGHPVQRADYYRAVARQAGIAKPQFAAPDDNSAQSARAATNRRISNQRMQDLLGDRLRFATYREGVRAIIHPELTEDESDKLSN